VLAVVTLHHRLHCLHRSTKERDLDITRQKAIDDDLV